MKKYIPFLIFWLINFLVLYLFSLIFPNKIVFGNDVLSGISAALWTGFILTFFGWMAKPLFNLLKIKLTGAKKMFVFYLLVNIILIWILARFPSFTGFGISRFTWAIVMGLVINLLQYGTWEIFKKRKVV